MIVCNGIPKSGTHALMALLDTMGLRRHPGTILPGPEPYISSMPRLSLASLQSVPDNVYILAHVPASIRLEGFKILTIFRDPRNVLLSYIAHRLRRDNLIYTFNQGLTDFWGYPFIGAYRGYLGWRGRAAVIRYEDLPEHVVGNGSGIYRGTAHDWNTRTGKPNRWQSSWDATIEQAWAAAGGNELLAEAGYAKHG